VRKRRNEVRPIHARAASAAAGAVLRLCAKATHRPVDSMAILAAVAASLIIVVNAVFLQSGSLPTPYFPNPKPQPVVYVPPARPAIAMPALGTMPQPIAVRRNDPIADLIGPSPRIAAVQRALSDYGYGQIKPSGMLDDATSNAIEKFERERKLPVSGRVSDRLIAELTALVGHPLE
jgi:hypothetical protein